jgi:hypothetical protein
MENNPLQSRKGTKDRPRFLFIFVESLRQRPKVKLNQAQWQRASSSFTCTPLGLKPITFLEVTVSQNGLYQSVYISPAVMISLFFIAKLRSDK